MDAASKSAVEAAIKQVKDATGGDDVAAIKSAISNLEQASHALSKHMYDAAQAAAGAGGDGAASERSGDDDDVIDAEFEKKS
ncbi:MAG: hypothetical protein R3B90_22775 [Planctomycetaceae bacterium]